MYCKASNEITEGQALQPQIAEVKLKVKFVPAVNVREKDMAANEGSNLNITCDYYANPQFPISVTWLKNSRLIDTNTSKYVTQTGVSWLIINSILPSDQGDYSCLIRNSIGEGKPKYPINVQVLTVPQVSLKMYPESPIKENRKQNVTLFCDVMRGNPSKLIRVKWYMDGILLTELPRCQNPLESLCNVDPSKLILESVNREFVGLYSCVGFNSVGQSPLSTPVELDVLYPPGVGKIIPSQVKLYKNEEVNLTCELSNIGKPKAQKFIWFVQDTVIDGVSSQTWLINPIILGTQANISCVAFNSVGAGTKGFLAVEVLAKPTFLQNLPHYTGTPVKANKVEFLCQVECLPSCQIVWLRNEIPIRNQEKNFSIQEKYIPEVLNKGIFPSILSILTLTPVSRLSNSKDNSNFSCEARSREGALLLRSVTRFSVEFPPTNLHLSSKELTVLENTVPGSILCSAEGYPAPIFQWTFNGHVIQKDQLLRFRHNVYNINILIFVKNLYLSIFLLIILILNISLMFAYL